MTQCIGGNESFTLRGCSISRPIDRRTTRMTQAVAAPIPAGVDPRTRTQIVAAVLLGLFLAALDQTVVGTALPRIVTDLHGNDIYTWAFTAYILTATISGPIYGKLSDLFGRGRFSCSPSRCSSSGRC